MSRLRAAYSSTARSPRPGASLLTYCESPDITDLSIIPTGVAPSHAGSTISNKVISLGGSAPVVTTSLGNASNKVVPGSPLGAWYTRKIHSYDPATGVVVVGDTSEFVGNVLPTSQGSVNSTVTLFGNL